MSRLSCLICSLLLAGCAIPIEARVTVDCVWFTNQRFTEETKQWLVRDGDPPRHVLEDLNKVRKNNLKAEEFCGESR